MCQGVCDQSSSSRPLHLRNFIASLGKIAKSEAADEGAEARGGEAGARGNIDSAGGGTCPGTYHNVRQRTHNTAHSLESNALSRQISSNF